MKKISLVLSLFIISSCQSMGNKKTIDLYSSEVNKKSIEEIQSVYGNYSKSWKSDEGGKIYNYEYTKSYYTWPTYFPILAYFGSVISKNYEVVLEYNKKNELVAKNNFYNKAKSSTAFTCSNWGKSCIKKLYDEKPEANSASNNLSVSGLST